MAPPRTIWRRGKDDCLTDCVARIFNVHPETVPLFCAYPNWQRKLVRYFRKRGMGIRHIKWSDDLAKGDFIMICVGQSARGVWHAVLYIGDCPYFDPSYRRKPFITPKPQFAWVPYPLDIRKALPGLVKSVPVPTPVKAARKRRRRK